MNWALRCNLNHFERLFCCETLSFYKLLHIAATLRTFGIDNLIIRSTLAKKPDIVS